MLKRILALLFLLVPALTMTVPAAAFEARISLYSRLIEGKGGTVPLLLVVGVFDKNDNLKITARTTPTGPDGDWSVFLEHGIAVLPGDLVRIIHDGSIRDHRPASVKVTRVNPGSDIIAGRITPRKSPVLVHVNQLRMVWGGWTEDDFDRTDATDRDGRFQVDMTSTMNLKRNDTVYAGYREGDFLVYQGVHVPGLRIFVGDNHLILQGAPGRNYTATLLGGGSTVRGVSSYTTFPFAPYSMGGPGLRFYKRTGAPVRIRTGNRIRIDGTWGFTALVKPLRATLSPGTPGYLDINTFPGALVNIRLTRYDGSGNYIDELEAWRFADAGGHISHVWAGEAFAAGDDLRLQTQDGKGNVYYYSTQALP